MENNKKIKIKLQGHEKFGLREGWLTKGLICVEQDSSVFQRKDAPDIFGIGNNMVKSLRYWMKAFGLTEEKIGKGAFLTPVGKIIYEKDLYFEDIFTIWLLHSNIVKNVDEATSWHMLFNKCEIDELEKDQIEMMLYREISKYAMGITFSEKSVKNDLDVLLNMYSKYKGNVDPEDKSVSPLACLNLIKNVDGHYTKMHPDRRIISEWNILYELAEILQEQNSVSIENVVYGDNGLSKTYQITPIVANEFLDKIDTMGYIRVNRTAGLDVIYKKKDFTKENIMKAYYTKVR